MHLRVNSIDDSGNFFSQYNPANNTLFWYAVGINWLCVFLLLCIFACCYMIMKLSAANLSSYRESSERRQPQRPSPSSTKTWNLGMSPIAKHEMQQHMNWTSSPESGASPGDPSLTKAYKNNLIIDKISKKPHHNEEAPGQRRWAFRSVPSLDTSTSKPPSTRSPSPRPPQASSDELDMTDSTFDRTLKKPLLKPALKNRSYNVAARKSTSPIDSPRMTSFHF